MPQEKHIFIPKYGKDWIQVVPSIFRWHWKNHDIPSKVIPARWTYKVEWR